MSSDEPIIYAQCIYLYADAYFAMPDFIEFHPFFCLGTDMADQC